LFCYIAKHFLVSIFQVASRSVKEKIKQLIAEHVSRRAETKVTLHNMERIGALDESMRNRLLDKINEIDETIFFSFKKY
jgi:uncharacterized protein YgbK (DUF1537 family)